MALALSPLITQARLGHGLPDQVRVSIFADEPWACAVTSAQAVQVRRYLLALPGTTFDLGDQDRTGPGYTRRHGDLLCKYRVGTRLAMSVTFNPQRLVVRATGLASRKDDDDNTVLPLIAHGYDLGLVRECMCADIVDLIAKAKTIYLETSQAALGRPLTGAPQANLSILEVTQDFHGDQALIDSYDRAFRKVIIQHKNSTGLSGSLRKGERFAVYLKRPIISPAPIVRFEMAISGTRIKRITGTQRVPDTGTAFERLLTDVETRYLRVWLLIERHRCDRTPLTNGEFARLLPGIRDEESLERLAGQLGRTGRVRSHPGNRNILESLKRSGLIENLAQTTMVRGYRVTAPESDAHWQRWRSWP